MWLSREFNPKLLHSLSIFDARNVGLGSKLPNSLYFP